MDYPALAWSVINRVGARGFPDNLDGVTQQKDHNGNYELAYDKPLWRASGDPDSLSGRDALSYNAAARAAEGVLNGSIPDPTGGAQYFHSGPVPSKGFYPNGIASGRLRPSDYESDTFTFYRDTQ